MGWAIQTHFSCLNSRWIVNQKASARTLPSSLVFIRSSSCSFPSQQTLTNAKLRGVKATLCPYCVRKLHTYRFQVCNDILMSAVGVSMIPKTIFNSIGFTLFTAPQRRSITVALWRSVRSTIIMLVWPWNNTDFVQILKSW